MIGIRSVIGICSTHAPSWAITQTQSADDINMNYGVSIISNTIFGMEHPPLAMIRPCTRGIKPWPARHGWLACLHGTSSIPSYWVVQEWRRSSFQQRRLLLRILLQHIIDNQEAICRCVRKLRAGSFVVSAVSNGLLFPQRMRYSP